MGFYPCQPQGCKAIDSDSIRRDNSYVHIGPIIQIGVGSWGRSYKLVWARRADHTTSYQLIESMIILDGDAAKVHWCEKISPQHGDVGLHLFRSGSQA